MCPSAAKTTNPIQVVDSVPNKVESAEQDDIVNAKNAFNALKKFAELKDQGVISF